MHEDTQSDPTGDDAIAGVAEGEDTVTSAETTQAPASDPPADAAGE